LDSALNKERILDDLETDITNAIFKSGKNLDENKRKEMVLIGQTAENLERMGDELRSLMERIEIKIAEKLYFSETGIEQYKNVFEKMHKSVQLTVEFLREDGKGVLDTVEQNGEEIKKMIEKYRVEHMERLTKGICKPRAANMFFDMLDFTGNIARHCTNIARTCKEQ
ncbi:MAG: hypothetical protein HQ579_07420, partial [Candidatus Omnitrophica bacterium]|nr:hypothetical protein [Candidatus Omnitrophota bacterium]